jgi:hypothetical protein
VRLLRGTLGGMKEDDRREQTGRHQGHEDRGPEGTEFLDLEMSRVLFGEAEGLAREAARDLLRDALKERLRERLGPRLQAIAHVAADALADDVEANLGIEDLIRAHGERRRNVEERLRAALWGEEPGSKAPKPDAGRGGRKRSSR